MSNRSVNIHGGNQRCAALVYRTFVRGEPSLPLAQYQFKAKNGNPLDFAVDNIQLCAHAKLTMRKPRKNLYQKYAL